MTGERLRRAILTELYGSNRADEVGKRIEQILAAHAPSPGATRPAWSERDAWLITYADQFQAE